MNENGLKDALEYVVEQSRPFMWNHSPDVVLSSKSLRRVEVPEPEPQTIFVSTLQGLVDFVNVEEGVKEKNLIAHVIDFQNVTIASHIFGKEKQRSEFISASIPYQGFTFDRFANIENFIIGIQSQFVQDETTAALLKIVGTMKHESVVQTADDGTTQRVEARAGIVKNAQVDLPNPVELRPFRTFREVEQPASKFVLRIQNSREITAGLFEADGGAWKVQAIENIKDWLREKMPKNVTAIG